MDPQRRTAIAVLVLVGGCLAINNAVWLAHDSFPCGYEVTEHLLFAQLITRDFELALDSGDLLGWVLANRRIWTRATGVHLALAPAALLWPGDAVPLVTWLSGSAAMALLLVAIYRLARQSLEPPDAALTAAAALCCPGVWATARKFGMDLPLAAAVAWLAVWLTQRRPWDSARRALAWGLAAGLLCLVKAQMIFWAPLLVLPTLWGHEAWRARLAQFTLGAAAGSALFWAGDLPALLGTAAWHVSSLENTSNEVHERFTWWALVYYPVGLWRWAGPGAWPLLVAGGLAALRKRPSALLLCWLVGGLALHTLIAVKWVRYMLPALPALVLAASLAAPDRARRALLLTCVCAGLAVALYGSWRPLPEPVRAAWLGEIDELVHPPIESNWREAMKPLAALQGEGRRLVGVEAPESWTGDDFSRLELYVSQALDAEVRRDSAFRAPSDREAFRELLPRMQLRIVVSDPTLAGEPEPPAGWRRWRAGGLWPAVQPDVDGSSGPPLRWQAWVPAR